jgi:hypothetical protein
MEVWRTFNQQLHPCRAVLLQISKVLPGRFKQPFRTLVSSSVKTISIGMQCTDQAPGADLRVAA